jgi:predicted transcriptional regulator
MKVRDVMTPSAVCCNANTNVGVAVELLWVRNCGMLPVIGPDQKPTEIVTECDIQKLSGGRLA